MTKPRRRRYLLWGLFWVVLIVPMLLTGYFIALREGEASQKYIPELRKIVAETPQYPGSRNVGERLVAKETRVTLYVTYESRGKRADIRNFYDETLTKAGWKKVAKNDSWFGVPPSDFEYHRGAYAIIIEDNGLDQSSYVINYRWDSDNN